MRKKKGVITPPPPVITPEMQREADARRLNQALNMLTRPVDDEAAAEIKEALDKLAELEEESAELLEKAEAAVTGYCELADAAEYLLDALKGRDVNHLRVAMERLQLQLDKGADI